MLPFPRAVVAAVGALLAGLLADLISKALSTDGSQVSIGAVDGALSSDATIRDIVISDRDGPWLRLDRARLVWTRSALLLRRLEVNRLEIGKLEILRKPVPEPGAPPPADNSPILPELPLKVIVEAFQLGELALGPTVIGAPARLSATGAARLEGSEIPTLKEAGVDLVVENWRMVAAAPEITEEQKAAINADIEKMVTSATWKQTLETKGWQDMYLAGADFDAQLASDIEATTAILKDIGLVQ